MNSEAEEAVRAVFGPGGTLSRALPSFEYRPQQVEMAACVWRAFDRGRIALVEAGTGTGKSLAYLYPGLIQARLAGKPLVVSTNTINLQQQLLGKDLPMLARLVEEPPRAALLLGRHNYLCRRRYELARARGMLPLSPESLAALEGALTEGRGERGSLGSLLPREHWEAVASDGELCLRQRCPWAQECFWQRARRAAAEAEILLVNHHLLLADVAVRRAAGWDAERAVLPAYDRVVLDEAHHLEDIATTYFSTVLSHTNLDRLLGRLYHREGPAQQGILAAMQLGLGGGEAPTDPARLERVREAALGAAGDVERAAAKARDFFFILRDLARSRGRRDGSAWQWRYSDDLRTASEALDGAAGDLDLLLSDLENLLERIYKLWEGPEAETPSTEEGLTLRAAGSELGTFRAGLQTVLDGGARDSVHWLEAGFERGREETAATSAPLAVGPDLYESLLSNLHGAVLSSATLSADGDFSFVRERLGVDYVHPSERLELSLPSPFDHRRLVLLSAVTDLPGPDDPSFPRAAASFLSELLRATGGRALILFTSFRSLEQIHALLSAAPPPGVGLLRQGEKPREALLDEFQHTPGSVLLGTDSFWEGVDVPGLALSCVVVARLPFRVPTEPLYEARMEYLAARGENPFTHYSLPQAVIKFKQGFGRLVRRADDRGAVVVLDNRFLTRPYGRLFHKALPACTECFGKGVEVIEAVGKWLEKGKESDKKK